MPDKPNSLTLPLIVLLYIVAAMLPLTSPLLHPQQMIWPASGLGSDASYLFYPPASRIHQSDFAIWDSSKALGRPLAGDIMGMWLYPFNWGFLVLPPAWGFTVFAVLHLALTGIFTHLLARSLFRLGHIPALTAGLTAMLMPKLIAHLAGGHFGNLYGFAWLPATLLGIRVAIQRRQNWPAVLAGIAFALQFPTHQQIPISTLYLAIGMSAWWLLQTARKTGWNSQETRGLARRMIVVAAIVGITSALISAAWWLPIIELLPYYKPLDFSQNAFFWYHLPVGMLFTIFVPPGFQFPEWTIYMGSVPLGLALTALQGKYRREARYLWAAIGLALLVSIGKATPFYAILRTIIPGLQFFRTTTRLWFLGGFAMALLAGLGVESIRRAREQQKPLFPLRWLKLTTIAYVFGLGLWLGGMFWYTGQLNAFQVGAFITGTCYLILLGKVHQTTLRSKWLLVLLPALTALELIPLAASHITTIDPNETFLKTTPLSDYLTSQTGIYRLLSLTSEPPYALTTQLGIDRLDGIVNLQLEHAVRIIHLATGCDENAFTGNLPACLNSNPPTPLHLNPSLLGLLNVRYVLSAQPLQNAELTPRFTQGEATLYENLAFMPRAFLAAEVQPLSDETNLSDIDPTKTALIETTGSPISLPDTPLQGEARIVSALPGNVQIETQSNRAALLVYSETWAPAWKAQINGHPTPLYRTNGALLGVLIPPGNATVTLQYRPLTWKIGVIVSWATLVTLALAGAYALAQKHLR